jgi:hypothetical protein
MHIFGSCRQTTRLIIISLVDSGILSSSQLMFATFVVAGKFCAAMMIIPFYDL